MRAGIRLDDVVAAAAAIADSDGWEQATPGNVAARLGIRTPSLYNHVDGLPGLRRVLRTHALRLLLDRLRNAAVGQGGRQSLLELGLAYIGFVREHPGLYEAVNRQGAPGTEPIEQTELAGQIMDLFARLLRPLGCSDERFVHALRGLRSLVHGFASLETLGGFRIPVDTDESLLQAVNFYLDGLLA